MISTEPTNDQMQVAKAVIYQAAFELLDEMAAAFAELDQKQLTGVQVAVIYRRAAQELRTQWGL